MKPLPCLTLFVESGRKFKLPSGETFDSLRRPQPDSICSTDSSTSTGSDTSVIDSSSAILMGSLSEEMEQFANGAFPKSLRHETPEERGARLVISRQSEAQRLKERLSQIPWHAQRAAERGETYWLELAASYQGD